MVGFGSAVDIISAAVRVTMLRQVTTDEVRGRPQGVFIAVCADGLRIGDVAHGFAAATLGNAGRRADGGVLVAIGMR